MNEFEKMVADDLRAVADEIHIAIDVDAVLADHRAATRRRRALAAAAAGVVVIPLVTWAFLESPWGDRTAVPNPLTPPSAVTPAPSPAPTVAPTPTAQPGTPTAEPAATPTAGSPPTASPPLAVTPVSVYFIDAWDGRNAPLLTRETRLVPSGTPARGALEALIAGPEDPDAFSPWPTDTAILGISERDGIITVDLSAEARDANVGAAFEARMVESLVWTVTEAYRRPDARVRLLVEGQPAGDTWGHLVWDEPVARGAKVDALVPVLLDRVDVAGADATSSALRTVTVTGEAVAFEATLGYRVLRADGSLVTEGFVQTAEGQAFAPFSLTLELPPGSYVFELAPSDPSDGAAGPIYAATRTVTVG